MTIDMVLRLQNFDEVARIARQTPRGTQFLGRFMFWQTRVNRPESGFIVVHTTRRGNSLL